jgi:hypothetical protein
MDYDYTILYLFSYHGCASHGTAILKTFEPRTAVFTG